MNVTEVLRVMDQLVPFLTAHRHPEEADWLANRAALLRNTKLSVAESQAVLHEIHCIIVGMGGLMDLHVIGSSPEERVQARNILWQLGDKLFQLTK